MDASPLRALAALAAQGTNLNVNPARYSDEKSLYTGYSPVEPGVLGETILDDPRMVNLRYTDFGTNRGADRTLAHEGTHSKLMLNEIRKNIDKPPSLNAKFRGNIYDLLETDPEFFKEYFGSSKNFKDVDPEYMRYALDSDEVLARLNAIEGMMPAGSTIEKSKYGKVLFGDNNEHLDMYLNAVIPEGYIRDNTSSFVPLEDQRSLREKVRDWLNRIK